MIHKCQDNQIIHMPFNFLTIKRFVFIALIFFTLTATAASEQKALELVNALGLGNNFPRMCSEAILRTQTFQIMLANVGKEKTTELVTSEFRSSIPKYQVQWDTNLAKSWAPMLEDSEIDSIVALKQSSPFAVKFSAAANEVGTAMQALSRDLLVKAVAEIIGNSFKKTIP